MYHSVELVSCHGAVSRVFSVSPKGWTTPVPWPRKVQTECHASRAPRLFNLVRRIFEKEASGPRGTRQRGCDETRVCPIVGDHTAALSRACALNHALSWCHRGKIRFFPAIVGSLKSNPVARFSSIARSRRNCRRGLGRLWPRVLFKRGPDSREVCIKNRKRNRLV